MPTNTTLMLHFTDPSETDAENRDPASSPLISAVVVTWNRKQEVIACLSSLLNSIYPHLEVIVVDNGSTDGTAEEVERRFPQVVLVKNDKNQMAAGGRNAGLARARGDYLFFVDSDNIVDRDAVSRLYEVISSEKDIGLVGPKMYYLEDPNRIWYAGATINYTTSKTAYIGSGDIDAGQHDQIREVDHIPNAFMVSREVVNRIGGFEERYGIMYEESDFACRARRDGFKSLLVPDAKVWHNIRRTSQADNPLRGFGMESSDRAYRHARNRILFMKRNASRRNYLIFASCVLPLFVLYYAGIISFYGDAETLTSYVRGVWDGLWEGDRDCGDNV